MPKPLLTIHNHHIDEAGEPPEIDADAPGNYVGYFMNEFGEQWVYMYDCATRKATLRGGDIGWDRIVEISDAQPPADVTLNEPEHLWLRACWAASPKPGTGSWFASE